MLDAEERAAIEAAEVLLAEGGYAPRIICESAGTQAEDALAMKNTLKNLI